MSFWGFTDLNFGFRCCYVEETNSELKCKVMEIVKVLDLSYQNNYNLCEKLDGLRLYRFEIQPEQLKYLRVRCKLDISVPLKEKSMPDSEAN